MKFLVLILILNLMISTIYSQEIIKAGLISLVPSNPASSPTTAEGSSVSAEQTSANLPNNPASSPTTSEGSSVNAEQTSANLPNSDASSTDETPSAKDLENESKPVDAKALQEDNNATSQSEMKQPNESRSEKISEKISEITEQSASTSSPDQANKEIDLDASASNANVDRLETNLESPLIKLTGSENETETRKKPIIAKYDGGYLYINSLPHSASSVLQSSPLILVICILISKFYF